MKRLKRSLKIFVCCLACCVAMVGFASQENAEAAVNPRDCRHQCLVTGYSIVGHYTDYHVPCSNCGDVCKREHNIRRTHIYCNHCYLSDYYDEDIVYSHSAQICKDLLKELQNQ